MFNNPYLRGYMPNYQNGLNQQSMYEQIDGQINQLQQMKEQLKNNNQQPAINQTFQLAPNGHGGIRYVNSIDDVSKEAVFIDTPFFSKDLSVVWLKNSKGDIKAYELKEIEQKDEKDLQIDLLVAKINELEGMIKDEQSNTNDIKSKDENNTTTNDDTIRKSVKESKSTSVSRISKSKG